VGGQEAGTMTEVDWIASDDPAQMLEHLLLQQSSERKIRLFDCACWRRRAPRFLASGGRPLLEAIGEVEAHVDGDLPRISPKYSRRFMLAGRGVLASVRQTVKTLSTRPRLGVPAGVLVGLLRDIFGNLFRPLTLDPVRRTPTVISLARAAYDERQLPSGELDPHRLDVLADSLEEAGAPSELVAHLRSPGPHVRGCFPVDLCLNLT
jgi:hypothetical protein